MRLIRRPLQAGPGAATDSMRLLSALSHWSQHQPSRLALKSRQGEITYRRLEKRTDGVARQLRDRGIGPGAVVGVFLERSLESTVAFVGILKSGATFLPLNPNEPEGRIRSLVGEAKVGAIATVAELTPRLDNKARLLLLDQDMPSNSDGFSPPEETHNGLAYLLPTSASSGPPKMVMICREALDSFLQNASETLEIGSTDVCLHAAPITFAAGIRQCLLPLSCGATVIVASNATVSNPLALWELVRETEVSFLDFVPSYWSVFIESLAYETSGGDTTQLESSLQRVASVGEALPGHIPADWRNRLRQDSRFFNLYGQTETTGLVSCFEVPSGQSVETGTVPIGRPIKQTEILVLEEDGREAATSQTGEIWVRSASLMSGYLDHPELTAVGDDRKTLLYRTGDLGRWRTDGVLEIVGRGDQQVKVGGRRLDLGELESLLNSHPAIRRAAVTYDDRTPGLSAFVVPCSKNSPVVDSYRRHTLPNGLSVAIQNPSGNGLEARALFEEIFGRNCYLQHGIRLPSEGTIVDIGANIGMFTLFAGLHSPGLRLLSFEPLPPTFAVLKVNARLFGLNARLFNVGLSSRESAVKFAHYPEYSTLSGIEEYADTTYEPEFVKQILLNERQAGIDQDPELLENIDGLLQGRFDREVYHCQLRPLSAIIQEEGLKSIALLKIDVQRAELDVLRGIEDPHWEMIDQVVMEFHDKPGGGTAGRTEQITERLEEVGFEVTVTQDESFRATDRYNLYARRPERVLSPASSGPDPGSLIQETAVLDTVAVESFAKQHLPEWAVPKRFRLLDELPTTSSGKIDRLALSDIRPEAGAAPSYVAPRTVIESIVAESFCTVLGLDRLGIHDNFFQAGADSLSIIRVRSLLPKRLDRTPTLAVFFDHPTVARVATHVLDPRQAHTEL